MTTYEDALGAVKRYASDHRHPERPQLDISLPYDLLPHIGSPGLVCGLAWPHPYPHAGRAGVYLILDGQGNVLYVGKASMGNDIGSRLGSHFGYAVDRETCRPRGSWGHAPRFVVAIAVPSDGGFEAPSLEEFLICELQPAENKKGMLGQTPP